MLETVVGKVEYVMEASSALLCSALSAFKIRMSLSICMPWAQIFSRRPAKLPLDSGVASGADAPLVPPSSSTLDACRVLLSLFGSASRDTHLAPLS